MRDRLQRKTTTFYLLLRMTQAAVLIIFLLGSLALTGGQVGASKSPMWDAVLDFPLFTLPGWLMLTVSALGALVAVGLLSLSRVTDAGRIGGAFSTTAAATVSWFMLAWALPAGFAGEQQLRWTAAFVEAGVLAVLLVVSLVLAVLSDRRRVRQGLPVWTVQDDDD